MSFSYRPSTLVLSAAALLGVLATAPAEAASWWPFSTSSGTQSRQLPSAAAPAPDATVPTQLATNGGAYRDGTYKGPTVDAYYGPLQVQANIQGGQLVSVEVLQYPADRRTSRSINAQALPMLESEVVSAQNTQVDIISGATLTSEAYLRSLTSALGKAGQGL